MTAKIMIYLHADQLANPSWIVTDNHLQIEHSEHRGDPNDLVTFAADREAWVIVPSEDVLLLETKLPKMSRHKAAQAIPFSLEEQLTDDVEDLHFTVLKYQEPDRWSTAIVSHQKMVLWLELLKSWQIKPDVMLPAVFALPFVDDAWHVAIAENVVVRTGEASGFACNHDIFYALIKYESHLPPTISIQNYTDTALAPLFTSKIHIVEEQLPSDSLLKHAIGSLADVREFNLLQSAYVSKKTKFPARRQLLKYAMLTVTAWGILLFLYPVVSYFMFNQELKKLHAQVVAIYHRQFPNATSVVAPKIRLEDKLKKLQSTISENHLFQILGVIGTAMKTNESIKLKRMDYQSNRITLELTALSADDFGNFTDFLSTKGLHIKQQNATLNGAHINATISVE